MEPDFFELQPPNGSSDHESSRDLINLDGEDSGLASRELLRICNLLEIIGDPTRLRILLSLHSEAKTTLDLVVEVPTITEDSMSQQIDFLRSKALIESNGRRSHQAHNLTELGRKLVQVALSFGIDWQE